MNAEKKRIVNEISSMLNLPVRYLNYASNNSSFPVYFFSIAGILTLPISSQLALWVQLSRISTRSPAFRLSIFFTDSRKRPKGPLSLAINMLKLPTGMPSGTIAETSEKAWLSVITTLKSRLDAKTFSSSDG